MRLAIFGCLLGWIHTYMFFWLCIYIVMQLFRLARWLYWQMNDSVYYSRLSRGTLRATATMPS
jgi:hypothetical protein